MSIVIVHEYTYICVMVNSLSRCLYSITVAPVNITSQPVSQTVNRNSTAVFTVVASGGGTITYQWQIGDVDLNDTENEIVGANTGNLQVLNAQDADEGIYTCVVTNSANDFETSDPAMLTVGKLTLHVLVSHQ